MKILLFDIEVSPILGWAYNIYDTNIIKVERDWHMMSWSAKWQGEKTITRSLFDYKDYRSFPYNDKALVTDLWKLFNEADVLIGHNGDGFDIKKTKARMIYHGLTPPRPTQTIDTLKVARKHFAFTSNKLEDLAIFFGVGTKTKVKHGSVWRGCLAGNEKDWSMLKRYNERDVVLLKGIYERMKPYIENHPRVSDAGNCPRCNGLLQRRGYSISKTGTYQRYQCKACASWSKGKYVKLTDIR